MSIDFIFVFIFLVVYFFCYSKVKLVLGHPVNYIIKLDVCEVEFVKIAHKILVLPLFYFYGLGDSAFNQLTQFKVIKFVVLIFKNVNKLDF